MIILYDQFSSSICRLTSYELLLIMITLFPSETNPLFFYRSIISILLLYQQKINPAGSII
ncbi:MAG TPA: hypothetical protein DCY58_11840 [Acetobacterium sp.]|nr:hypothetical protein [Acetobacterium sp.]